MSIEEMDQFPDPYAFGSEFDLDEPVALLCSNISERDRRIVQLHIFSGIELCAIAEILELSVSAAQKAYQRALAKMRAAAMESA